MAFEGSALLRRIRAQHSNSAWPDMPTRFRARPFVLAQEEARHSACAGNVDTGQVRQGDKLITSSAEAEVPTLRAFRASWGCQPRLPADSPLEDLLGAGPSDALCPNRLRH